MNANRIAAPTINKKKGKTRSKQFGRVEIPQEAFIGVLKINKDS